VELKAQLCRAAMEPTQIVDFNEPYVIEVDSSNSTIGAVLLQTVEGQGNKPVAFTSQKLTTTQRSWSTIEKDAFAAIWALDKFRKWIFNKPVTLYSDHNPLTYMSQQLIVQNLCDGH